MKAFACEYAFWAGGYWGEALNSNYVEQSILIPSNALELKFMTCFYRLDDDDPVPEDEFKVTIDGEPVFTKMMTTANNSYPDWVEQTVDISSYADQVVTLRFEAVSNGSTTGNVLVDMVTIEGNACLCDLNGDGSCNMKDWIMFRKDWGRTDCSITDGSDGQDADPSGICEGDLNNDGNCNMID